MNISHLPSTVLAITLGVAFLYTFYRAVQLKWPESYFGATELSAYSISLSPIRYILFRLAPVYVTALFAAVTVDRIGGSGYLTALGIGVVHALATSGWSLFQAFRLPKDVRKSRFPIILIRCSMLVLITGAALMAAFSMRKFNSFIPPISEISATIWTGIIAGVFGAFIVKVTSEHASDDYEIVNRARNDVPADMWYLIGKLATEAGVDVDLARAIMLVENIQRPKWFRRIERAKGFVFPKGTYGIMQVSSDIPLSDTDSIEKVIQDRLVGANVRMPDGNIDSEALENFSLSYNHSADYSAFLEKAMYSLLSYGNLFSSERQINYMPVIEVTVMERFDDVLRIEGRATVYEGTIKVQVKTDDETLYDNTVQALRGGPERGWWKAAIPVTHASEEIIISDTSSMMNDDVSTITIDLSEHRIASN